MKKLIIILFLISIVSVSLLVADSNDEALKENLKNVSTSVWDIGFIAFLKGGILNIIMFICSVGYIGQLIIRWTPNKKDDKFYEKYIKKPLYLFSKIISLGQAESRNTVKKNK